MKNQHSGAKPDQQTENQQNPHSVICGIISITSKGNGYLAVQDENGLSNKKRDRQEDPEIQPEKLHTALHGDEVEVRLLGKKSIDRRPPRMQAEVTRIISRAKTQFVGVLEQERGQYFLVPDDRRAYKDIVLKNAPNKVVAGTKAYVRMTGWEDGKNPEGEIIKLLGRKGDNNVEMESIVLEKGFETGFPAQVEHEAEHIERTEKPIPADEIARRRDFRQTLTMTIDPVDAKDFDDAISFKPLDKDAKGLNLYEIGVHIADVSHYVREKVGADGMSNADGGHQSALDKEAAKRGCSIYLVDRTIPMLPEVLSNDICSLNPNEDRLTFSAVFEINDRAEISKRWFGKTIIHSHKRFTYETAQASLNAFADGVSVSGKKDGVNAASPATAPHGEELTTLNTLAKKLAAQKFANGAIDFEKDEVKFELDRDGKPIRVYRKERLDTHKLVEEYMLLANREVAEFLFHKMEDERKKAAAKGASTRTAAIYRIHDTPDPERITDLAIFVRALGFDLESHDGKVTSRAIRKLLDAVTGSPQEELIKTATIRSMAKAVYSTQNIGHFGLGFKYYTHFTSPIRRYPDLLVQRVLFAYLEAEKTGIRPKMGETEAVRYEKMALHSTEQEILAAEAERSSIKYKQVEYMQDKVGQTFDGTITGVTDWGVYVEENETKCEGMIKVRDIGEHAGDFFALNEKTYSLVGEKTGKKFTLGDKVCFKVMSADMERKALDYALA